ncbi:MAG: hypothetical protein CL840_17455 [Crocinitomicaceae bacterium]|nr:hypothetical protein [Crocinitomicaceae bacterium]|tara:strand:- start:13389 stop:13667 length:279 start_codon:yes stop_codon:yes gene_type:complete
MKRIIAFSFLFSPLISFAGTSNDIQSPYLYGILGVIFIIILLFDKIYSGLKVIYIGISTWISNKKKALIDKFRSRNTSNELIHQPKFSFHSD